MKYSYLSVDWETQEKVLYCGTAEALFVLHGKPFSRLGKNQSKQKDSDIIIPFNNTGYHWIFIQLDLGNKRYCVIDPPGDKIDEDNETLVK